MYFYLPRTNLPKVAQSSASLHYIVISALSSALSQECHPRYLNDNHKYQDEMHKGVREAFIEKKPDQSWNRSNSPQMLEMLT